MAFRVILESGRENTITLAICSAEGEVMPPLIVVKEKNLQATWKGEKALPGGLEDGGHYDQCTQLFTIMGSKSEQNKPQLHYIS